MKKKLLNIDLEQINDYESEIHSYKRNDIAIIGVSCKLPKADNVEEFWNNLVQGVDCSGVFPQKRKQDIEEYFDSIHSDLESRNYYRGSFLDEIDSFDCQFFRLSPREASLMDPNQRMFLQVAWNALEDAGYCNDVISGVKVGVYLGFTATGKGYYDIVSQYEPEAESESIPGNLPSMIASRISYLLNLKGPSLGIDTACSSSLVAAHLACQGIRNGDCDMAIVGSSKINLFPIERKHKLGVESEDGRTRSFSANSTGTGSGEGVVALVLKSLAQSVKDQDHIYAVIKGSAINQDGNSIGITAPNVLAQEEVILTAWKNAGVTAEDLSYIEAHGTGTRLGDPIEIDALNRAFHRYTNKKQICAIGSCKTNLGHLDHASGVTSMLKALLCLQEKTLVPTIHFDTPNREIDFSQSALYVNDQKEVWNVKNGPRRCGISSFGLSGTNCHLVLEEAPQTKEAKEQSNMPYLLILSAMDESTLGQIIRQFHRFMRSVKEEELADICYTSSVGRKHLNHRLAILCHSKEEFVRGFTWLEQNGQKSKEELGIYAHSSEKYDRENKNQQIELQNQDWSTIECYRNLCQQYVCGADIDWNLFYQKKNNRRVSIPTYPFKKERCWVKLKDQKGRFATCELKGREQQEYSQMEQMIASIWSESLELAQIHINANFFELGGDSISAMKIAKRIVETTQIPVEFNDIIRYETIEELAKYLDSMKATLESSKKDLLSIPKLPKQEYYEITSGQKRMYILRQLDQEGTCYNLPAIRELKGDVNLEKINQVFHQIIMRHEVLRSSFEARDDDIVQIVKEQVPFQVNCIEDSNTPITQLFDQFVKPFDLGKAPLMRVQIVKRGIKDYLLFFDIHHIISDGFSINVLVNEFYQLYAGNSLEPIKIQYKDYTAWYNGWLKSEQVVRMQKFWFQMFEGNLPKLNLPLDFARGTSKQNEGRSIIVPVKNELLGQLKELSKQKNHSLFAVLLAMYNIFLSKVTGQEDIIVGTTVSGRRQKELDQLIGLFVNTIALRNYPQATKEFDQFLEEVNEHCMEAFKYQDYPFEELIHRLGLSGELNRNPLFDTAFSLINFVDEDVTHGSLNGLEMTAYENEKKTALFDLIVYAEENKDGMKLEFIYDDSLFKRETIESFAKILIELIEVIVKDPLTQIGKIDVGELDSTEVERENNDFSEIEFDF